MVVDGGTAEVAVFFFSVFFFKFIIMEIRNHIVIQLMYYTCTSSSTSNKRLNKYGKFDPIIGDVSLILKYLN